MNAATPRPRDDALTRVMDMVIEMHARKTGCDCPEADLMLDAPADDGPVQ